MSETIPGEMDKRPAQAAQQQGRPWLAIMLVGALAVCVAILTYYYDGALPGWVVLAGAFLAFAGLAGIVGYAGGFVHFGRLPRQRAFFDGLVDSLDEACVVADQRGRVIYCNRQYRELASSAGRKRLVGIENLYAGFPEISERVYVLSQAGRENKKAAEEIRLPEGSAVPGARMDGPSWVRISVSPLEVPFTGNYVLWRFRDVSDARAEQEKAFAHLQYIINYLDNAPAGFFSTRPDGSIAYINATLAGWLGIDLPGGGDTGLRLADIVGESQAKAMLRVKPSLEGAQTPVFDGEIRSRDNEAIPVRIIHRADVDGNGAAQPSRSLVLDMRTAESGAGAGAVFSSLMNNAPFGMAMIDGTGVIGNANNALVDLSPAACPGVRLDQMVRSGDRQAVADAIKSAAKVNSRPVSVNVVLEGDEERTATFVIARLEYGAREAESLAVYVIDTSRRSSLEEQLAQSQKMQAVGQLAGGVAHDLNNMLTAIAGFAEMLLAKHRPTDPSFAEIMNIRQSANRSVNLVRQLLAFSRRQTLQAEVLSLTDVIGDLGNLLGRLLGEKIELTVIHGRDLGFVKVDVNQFEQVVINLAVNARDAMNGAGALTIRTANVSEEESRTVAPDIMPVGEYVVCEIADTGSGMPPEVIDKIYEPFFTTKEVGKGTGLGLSTVYGIIKQTGGFIFCDSEVGKGTTFRIYLPRHEQEPQEEAAAGEEKAEVRREDMTGNGTVLLVEDEDVVRAFASQALASRGFTVIEADSAEAALEIIAEKAGEIDLVLSDVVMPEMDGPSMLKEMRKRGIQTKFIFISGYAEDAFEKNLQGEEDFAFLPKPFSLKQLTEAVKKSLVG